MTLHILPDLEQGSEEWHDQRRGIITASVVGKLLTPTLKVADNDVSRGITATLAAERITGWTEETAMTPDMWRGVEHEPYARDVYSEHYARTLETICDEFIDTGRCDHSDFEHDALADGAGDLVTTIGFMLREENGWRLGYSPDGLVGDNGLIEIKCPRAKTHVRTILADEVPAQYMAQLQAGLLVSGRDWIDFVSYVAGMPLYVKRVFPDFQWFEAIATACIAFEANTAQIVADYETRVDGLPMTERLNNDLGLVF